MTIHRHHLGIGYTDAVLQLLGWDLIDTILSIVGRPYRLDPQRWSISRCGEWDCRLYASYENSPSDPPIFDGVHQVSERIPDSVELRLVFPSGRAAVLMLTTEKL